MGTGADVFDRYVSILGVEAEEPSLEHLSALVRAQVIRVPFENISKIWLKKSRGATSIPSLGEHLDGIEKHNFGGTCYANNPYFALLLRHLGYQVSICGADMSKPDVHVVSLVDLDGQQYLVDVGYAAPFFAPIPRDLDLAQNIPFGRHRYVLHPQDDRGRSRMDHLRDGEIIHGYVVNPTPRGIGHFGHVIRNSYSDSATFMNVAVIERFFPDRSVRIHNLTVTESTPDSSTTTHLEGKDELIAAIGLHCGFPADITGQVISEISLQADIYS